MTAKRNPSPRCCFCGKSKDVVRHMLTGPADVRICNECVELSRTIIATNERIDSLANETPGTLCDAAIYLDQHAKVLRTVTSSDASHVEKLAAAVRKIGEQMRTAPTDEGTELSDKRSPFTPEPGQPRSQGSAGSPGK